MRIWIINPYDNIPGEGAKQRYWTLSETLSLREHDVTWWSSVWSHRRKAKRTVDKCALRQAGNFELRLVDVPAYFQNVGLARSRNHRIFARNLEHQGNALFERDAPDVVLFSWPPMDTGRVALTWKKRYGCRVVIDVMDAWPDNFMLLAPRIPGARSALRLALNTYYAKTRKVYASVDAISAQSLAFAEWAKLKGAKGQPHVCYLGASSLRVQPRKSADNSPPRLLYLGAMGRVYDLKTLVMAVERLYHKDGIPVELDLAGQGEQEADLRALVRSLKLESQIRFHGYLEGEGLSKLLERADIGIIPMRPESLVAVPYKAGEYLAAGLAVINSLPGEMAALIDEYQCGSHYTCGDVCGLVSVLRCYCNDRSRMKGEGRNGLRLFETHFNRSVTYKRWAEWLEGVM
ncbi:glycosyltransferase family 4 protein [Cerasicoccus fimbriatus]|uniref:glycosyltransferase family 4 protein n=1 Tax=Cerasicoccus fimbriatus TaxID=3014554 RepID=UPI0022B339B9|nr:glycosyltransferase family 4 protein [Cerasicoccus sp. TK19100]